MTDPTPRQALRERTLRGVRWITIARFATEVGAFVSTVVLAHLISPAEFGRATLAGLLGGMFAAALFRAVGAPLITRKAVERNHLQTGLLLSLAIGAAMTVAALVAARYAFGPLFGGRVAELGQLASPVFLAGGVAAVPRAVLLRKLDFKRTSAVDMTALSTGIVTALGLALAGVNAEALIIGGLAAAAAEALLMLLLAPVPLPRWDRGAARELVSFGLPASLASMLNAVAKNVDYAILGAKLSAAQVGLYWRAYRLGVEYQAKLTDVMMQLALPVYSRTEGIDDMQRVRFRVTRVHASTVLPLLALFIPVAPVLVPWLFGDPWEPAVTPSQILAVGGMAAALGSGTGSFVLAAGRPWLMVRFNTGVLVLFSTAVFFTAPHGLNAVCAGVVAARLILLVANYHVLLRPLIGGSARRLWAEAVPGVVASAITLLAVWPVTEWLRAVELAPLPLLTVVTGAGVALYVFVLRVVFPATLSDLRLLVRSVLRRGQGSSEPTPAMHAS